MDEMQKLSVDISHLDGRVETGPVEFTYTNQGRTDWSGYYLRGDDYMRLQCLIRELSEHCTNGGLALEQLKRFF